jgi:hypothetical protein
MLVILLIIILLVGIGGGGWYGARQGWQPRHYGSGGVIGILLVILIVWLLLRG